MTGGDGDKDRAESDTPREDANAGRRVKFVNALLFDTPGGMRYTQDSPILPTIWIAFAREQRMQQELILEVDYTQNAGEAAAEIRRRLLDYRLTVRDKDKSRGIVREMARVSYIPGQIAAKLYFDELIRVVLPLTTWWADMLSRLSRQFERADRRADGARFADQWRGFPTATAEVERQLLQGQLLMRRELLSPTTLQSFADDTTGSESRIAYEPERRRLLGNIPADLNWLVRIAGLIGHCFINDVTLLSKGDGVGKELARDFDALTSSKIEDSIERARRIKKDALTFAEAEENRRIIVRSFLDLFDRWDPERETARRYLFRANKNRRVHLAVNESALTVKADAARLLFNISCASITWAVIDSGIDDRHLAFRDTTDKHALEIRRKHAPPNDPDGLSNDLKISDLRSRVITTLDFTHLRELLDIGLEITEAGEINDTTDIKREKLVERIARNVAAKEGVKPEQVEGRWEYEPRKQDIAKAKTILKDFGQKIRAGRNVDWGDMEDMIVDKNPPTPENDHGTHVAGILAADWIEHIDTEQRMQPSFRTRRLRGVCPDIKLIDVRVFREDGLTDEFELMAAIQYLRWMNSRAGYMQVHGANLSVSLVHEVRRFACGQTPICVECDEASASGMVIVAAAGNRGFDFEDMEEVRPSDGYRTVSVTDPGNAATVITVGATHRKRPHEYGVSYFSSRGPTGDGRLKPDVVAPGEKIEGPIPDNLAEVKDGTSMAAPHVSGVAAMLMARHSELVGRPARVKDIICRTATDLGRERYFQGHGLVDALRALQSI